MSAPKALSTDRLLLRQFRLEDFEAYAAIMGDEEVSRYLGDGKPRPRGIAWREIATTLGHWELLGFGHYAVERQSDGVLLGKVGFLMPESWPEFELGWVLGRGYWGLGYATEAARACLGVAFDSLQRERVASFIRPDNEPSKRVAARIGETHESAAELLGGPIETWGITRRAWEEQR